MKPTFTQAAFSCLLVGLPVLASAQQTPTSLIDYRNGGGTGNIEKRTATETVRATSFTFGSYSTGVSNDNEATTSTLNDVFALTNYFDDQIDGRALVWRQNNTDTRFSSSLAGLQFDPNTPMKAQVKLTFTRAVTGLTFVIQDIDLSTLTRSASTGGSDFTDEVDFYPLDDEGKPVDMLTSNVARSIGNSRTCEYLGPGFMDNKTQVALRGVGLNGTISDPRRAGNVTITFKKPIRTIWLSYRNLNTDKSSNSRLQTIAFEQISWDAQADLTTTIVNSDAGPLRAGATGKFTVTFSNVGDLDTDNVQAKVQLSPSLTDVKASNGGVYDSKTGIVTYPVGAIAPYQGKLASVITYTAPAKGTLVKATATISTTTSEGLNPNSNTADATATPIAPLPVELVAFEAKAASGDAKLSWTTASELLNDRFEVERSLDGQTYTQVGRVAGHGTTPTASTYAYVDAGAAYLGASLVYYRLRQVDTDGTSTYSPVRAIRTAAAEVARLDLYPNPATATDVVTLDLLTLPPGAYEATLVNALGSTVARCPVQGGRREPLPLPTALAGGTYVVLVQGNGLRLTQHLSRH